MIHIRLCGPVTDKNFFTRSICGNKTTFFDLMLWFFKYAKYSLKRRHCPVIFLKIFKMTLANYFVKSARFRSYSGPHFSRMY